MSKYIIEKLKIFAKSAGNFPGVYKMISKSGKVLYVGKAKNLSSRIMQYSNLSKLPTKFFNMVSLIDRIEVLKTSTEAEALFLEDKLIKNIQPRYNTIQKDDKSFAYLVIDNHLFPKIGKYRGTVSDEFMKYGPFISSDKLDKTILELQKIFLIRSCSDYYFKSRKRPCLKYQIKMCSAPCVMKISESDYQEAIKNLKNFLEGKYEIVFNDLQKRMLLESTEQRYEDAAKTRDRIKLLRHITTKNIFQVLFREDTDIFILYKIADKICIKVFSFKNGCDLGDNLDIFDDIENQALQLSYYIDKFYQNHAIPKNIFTNIRCDKLCKKYNILTPKKGDKKKIIDFAVKNTAESFQKYMDGLLDNSKLHIALMKNFKLKKIPQKIEIYDNSHNQGKNAVACIVAADQTGFITQEYKKYKMLHDCADDLYMLKKAISNRLKSESLLPDLIIIDGGAVHLDAAYQELKNYDIDVISIAKSASRKHGEEVFYKKDMGKVILNDKQLLFFLQRLRDEAHRFAVSSHKKYMQKSITKSALDKISGIGEKRKKALLLYFGSLDEIKKANVDDIAKVDGFNQILAKKVFQYIPYF